MKTIDETNQKWVNGRFDKLKPVIIVSREYAGEIISPWFYYKNLMSVIVFLDGV